MREEEKGRGGEGERRRRGEEEKGRGGEGERRRRGEEEKGRGGEGERRRRGEEEKGRGRGEDEKGRSKYCKAEHNMKQLKIHLSLLKPRRTHILAGIFLNDLSKFLFAEGKLKANLFPLHSGSNPSFHPFKESLQQ